MSPSFRIPRLLVLGLALSAVAGCASTGVDRAPAETPAGRTEGATDAVRANAAGPDYDRLESIARARADSARMRVSEVDVRFMRGMIHHHAQAIVMSIMAPENGAGPSVRTLAARIINAQRDEIALMQRWLRERGRPVPEVDEDGTIPGMDHSMHTQMVGMLSPDQLEELAAAQGAAYDRLYLSYMILHHEGAVSMVEDLFAVDGAAQDDAVFKVASDIQVDQRTEIARMRRMLDAMRPSASRRPE